MSSQHSSSRDLVENILDAGLPPDEVALEVSCEEIVSLAQDYRELVEQVEAAQRKVEAYDRARARVKIEGATRAEYVLLAESVLEQLEALRGELQKAWDILSVEGYADDPDWAGTRSIKDALDASNPAEKRDA